MSDLIDACKFEAKKNQYQYDTGSNDFGTIFHDKSSAEIAAEHITGGGRESKRNENLPVDQEDGQRGDVCCQIDYLCLGISCPDAEFCKNSKGNDQESSGPGTVEAIVTTDHKSSNRSGKIGATVQNNGVCAVIVEKLFVQNKKRRQRQDSDQYAGHDI